MKSELKGRRGSSALAPEVAGAVGGGWGLRSTPSIAGMPTLTSSRTLVTALTAALLVALAALAVFAPTASSQTIHRVTDWTSVTGGVASGTLGATSVTLSGSDVNSPPASTLDGSATVFSRAEFSPPLGASDAIHFLGSPGGVYTLQFGAPVTNPVLHLGSLASTLELPAGTQITRLSGDSQFSVAASTISGAHEPPTDDGNGSVRLSGTFSSIPFRATFQGADGIYLQVAVAVPAPPPAVPPAPATIITYPAPQPAVIWTSTATFRFTASIPGSTFECRIDGGAWAPCSSPYTTPPMAGGPHSFEARAISPAGVVDPTPAIRRFSVGQSTVRHLSCDVRPVRHWLITGILRGEAMDEANDKMVCQVANTARCPGHDTWDGGTLCVARNEICPLGARCTLTTTARWFDADENINWGAQAIAGVGVYSWDYVRYPNGTSERCQTGYDGDRCRVRATHRMLGDNRSVIVACGGALSQGAASSPGSRHTGTPSGPKGHTVLGPDSERRVECRGNLRIDPAQTLETVAIGGGKVEVLAPSAGIVELIGAILATQPKPSVAARAARPRIARVRKRVTAQGPVTLTLKLNAAARRILKRKRKLAVKLRAGFTEPTGKRVTRTTRVTLTPRAKRPRRCQNPYKRSSRAKRLPRLPRCGARR